MSPERSSVPDLAADLRRITAILKGHAGDAGAVADAREAQAAPDRPESGASPIDVLCRTFALTPFERDVLLLCAGVELDPDCASVVARLQDGAPPTFALALSALPEAHWSALLPASPLRHWGLIELGSGSSLVGTTLRIDERILHYLVGLQYLDDRLAAFAIAAFPAELAPSHAAIAERMTAAWQATGEDESRLPILELCGDDLAAQGDIAARACALAGSGLLVLHARDLPESAEALERLQRIWEREALLTPVGLMIVCDSCEDGANAGERRLESVIERSACPLILSGIARRAPGKRTILTFEVARPAPAEQLPI